MNGAAGKPDAPFARARRPGAKGRDQTTRRRFGRQRVEETILGLLRSSPGMRTAAIARATAAQRSTTDERLKRLQAKAPGRARRRRRRVASAGLTAQEIADLLSPGSARPCERWIKPLVVYDFWQREGMKMMTLSANAHRR